jgi:membrane fusion protein (multidrug efflux system)
MTRKILVSALALLVILGALAGVKALQISAMVRAGKEFTIPPETVSSTEVRQESWDSVLTAVGTVRPVQGVVLRAELPGTVREIAFESGRDAAAGQLLVQLDISSEQARLRSAEAQAELARLNLERARNLRDQALISQAEYDAAEAAFRQGSGAVDDIRASIAKKTIRAPFSGRLGIRTVNLGQFVSAGDPIVSLQSLDPVFVDFSLPEQQFSLVRRDLAVRVTTDAVPGRTFTGPLTALNADVDAATRNIQLQATLPNPDGALRAGMFARVELVLPESKTFLVVPATAVLHAPYGDSVFVIADEAGDKAASRGKQARLTTVRLGETRGDFVAVTQGLEAGQTIASSGVFKLRNGSPVVVDNTLAPDARTNPKPTDS